MRRVLTPQNHFDRPPVGINAGRKENRMTYLEILSYARKGIDAEIEKLRAMQEKAIEGQAHDIMRYAQEAIESLEVKRSTLDEIEEIHNRK